MFVRVGHHKAADGIDWRHHPRRGGAILKTIYFLLTQCLFISMVARVLCAQISQQSRQFIADVVGDDLLQKEGGHALWQSIKYAIQPGIIR